MKSCDGINVNEDGTVYAVIRGRDGALQVLVTVADNEAGYDYYDQESATVINIDTDVLPKVAFVDQSSNASQFYWSGIYRHEWSMMLEQDFGFILNAVDATREINLWGSSTHADFGADTTITLLTLADE